MPSPRNRSADTPDTGQTRCFQARDQCNLTTCQDPSVERCKWTKRFSHNRSRKFRHNTSFSGSRRRITTFYATEIFDKKSETKADGWLSYVPGHVLYSTRDTLYRPAHVPETVLKPRTPIPQFRTARQQASWSDSSERWTTQRAMNCQWCTKEASLEMHCTPRGVLCALQPLRLRPPEA